MNCAECAQRLPEGARFCTACGRRVEPVLVCPQCQTQARDEARASAEAERRIASAIGALPTAQDAAPDAEDFSTRHALQGLYGGYDPHLDGALWRVSGAPGPWAEWNGRRVFIKPLISRSDEDGTRHVIVTNSVEVRDGLVVKEGAGCRECKSLLGAALYERRDDAWVLVTEQRFLRVGGAWGAPPEVDIDFPGQGGVEVRIRNASGDGNRSRKNVQAIVLHAGTPASASGAALQNAKGAASSLAAR